MGHMKKNWERELARAKRELDRNRRLIESTHSGVSSERMSTFKTGKSPSSYKEKR